MYTYTLCTHSKVAKSPQSSFLPCVDFWVEGGGRVCMGRGAEDEGGGNSPPLAFRPSERINYGISLGMILVK